MSHASSRVFVCHRKVEVALLQAHGPFIFAYATCKHLFPFSRLSTNAARSRWGGRGSDGGGGAGAVEVVSVTVSFH